MLISYFVVNLVVRVIVNYIWAVYTHVATVYDVSLSVWSSMSSLFVVSLVLFVHAYNDM